MRLCKKAQRDNMLQGLKFSIKGPKISHLIFVDDTMIFGNSDPKSCLVLEEILRQNGMASGQSISVKNSSIIFSKKMPKGVKARVKRELKITKERGAGSI